jgi:hypothetical protein
MNQPSLTISVTDKGYIVKINGVINNRLGLNDAMGRSLARMLQLHFKEKNTEPNKLNAPKTNFWKQVGDATALTTATPDGATVTIAERRFRIHLFGGVIKPTGGRKYLTIPLIAEARGLRASSYEQQFGRKLFRLPGVRLLFERSDDGSQSTISPNNVSLRKRDGIYKKITLTARTMIRPVYALAEQTKIQKDDDALPPQNYIVNQLLITGNHWLKRNLLK